MMIVGMDGGREVCIEVGEVVMTCSLDAFGELHVFMDRVRDVLCDVPEGCAVKMFASLPEGVDVKTLVQTQKEALP